MHHHIPAHTQVTVVKWTTDFSQKLKDKEATSIQQEFQINASSKSVHSISELCTVIFVIYLFITNKCINKSITKAQSVTRMF